MAKGSTAVQTHFKYPFAAGRPEPEAGFRQGRGGSVKHGVEIVFWLRCGGEGIDEIRFEAFGCPAAIACASWLCQYLTGQALERARALTGLDLARELALPAQKTGVALVAEDALQAALDGADEAP